MNTAVQLGKEDEVQDSTAKQAVMMQGQMALRTNEVPINGYRNGKRTSSLANTREHAASVAVFPVTLGASDLLGKKLQLHCQTKLTQSKHAPMLELLHSHWTLGQTNNTTQKWTTLHAKLMN